ncbi:MAG: hypothetical protein ACFFE4_14540 [Candidatus Thorarchaeota archaeon]
MADPKPKEIIQAKKFIEDGKNEEALDIVRKYQRTAWNYYYKFQFDKAMEISLQSKNLIKKIGEEIDYAYNFFTIGHIYLRKINLNESLKYGMKCLKIYEKLNDQANIGASYSLIGLIYWTHGNLGNVEEGKGASSIGHAFDTIKSSYNKAIENCKKSLSFNEITPRIKLDNLNALANIYLWRGDLTQSLIYVEEGIPLATEINLPFFLTQFFFGKGFIYTLMGDFSSAKENFVRTIDITEKLYVPFYRGWAILELITIFTEENSIDQAIKYLEILREYVDKRKNKTLSTIYSVSNGMMLYLSSRTRDRAEAEKLFRQVIDGGESPSVDRVSYMYALYGLIFMYVEELRMSNDLKIIEEINPLISLMYMKAEELQSNLFLIEGKIFQAKVELIKKKLDEAKLLLIEAQKLAEATNNQYFAQIISNEHDRLLELQINREQMKNTKNSQLKSIKLASFNGIANITQRDRSEGVNELIPETPVFILILTESGIPMFSYSFSQELSFEDDIISSFISAFNTFSGELFSKGLDRARFGEYIILIEPVDSYSICYLFKGQSYPAKQKLTSFIEEIQNEPTITDALDKFYNTSQVAELKDIPQIEILIKEIFYA